MRVLVQRESDNISKPQHRFRRARSIDDALVSLLAGLSRVEQETLCPEGDRLTVVAPMLVGDVAGDARAWVAASVAGRGGPSSRPIRDASH